MDKDETIVRERKNFSEGTPGEAKKFLIISVILAFLTSLIILGYVKNIEKKYEGQGGMTEVLVARRGIAANSVIRREDVSKKSFPRSALSERAITPDRIDWVVGQKTRWPIQSGEPILWTDLGLEKAGGLSQRIPTGYRAIAIAVDNITSVSGLVRPLDKVDIIGIFGGDSAITILQDVSVLSVGMAMEENTSGSGFSSVNILVTPEEAQMLSLAQQRTRLVLALRNPEEDIAKKDPERIIYGEIVGNQKPAELVNIRRNTPTEKRGRPVEIIVGGRIRK